MQSLNLDLKPFAQIRKERDEEIARVNRRQRKGALKRSYDAARRDRLSADFTVVNTSANFELRRSLRYIRARSRNLARNNDYVKKFLSMVRNNVAGPTGMKLQCRARNSSGELDQILNRQVEEAWKTWSHCENASLNRKLSWVEIQRKHINAMARDGEALIRIYDADNPFGFALRFYSADWLDETFNDLLPNGNRVVMSVELDQDDCPVAYYLTPPPTDYFGLDRDQRVRYLTRVAAEEIIHDFLMDDENADDDAQVRGVPWIHTAIQRLKILGAYEEAELVAARVGACKMGFFTEETPDTEMWDGDHDDDDGPPKLMDSAAPGQFGVIPAGYKFEKYDPSHPNTSYAPFIKGVLRGIAAGMDVTYFSLAEDLEAVNYSSARIGLGNERDTWRGLQYFQVEHLQRRVFLAWLRSSILTGALRLRPADYKRLTEPTFKPRGWRSIDPMKETQANIMAINNGLDTRTDVTAEQGGDFEENMATLAHEQKVITQKGIKLVATESKPTAQSENPPDEEEDHSPSTK